MSIQLEPSATLTFERPFLVNKTQILTIKNNNSTPVAFKVKTTAPQQYIVRPNSGFVESTSQTEVQVTLRAFKKEPPLDVPCKDKFLIQSTLVLANESLNFTDVWARAEKQKETIFEHKLKCDFIEAALGIPSESAKKYPLIASASTFVAKEVPEDLEKLREEFLTAQETISQLLKENRDIKSSSANAVKGKASASNQAVQSGPSVITFVIVILIAVVSFFIGRLL